MSEFITDEEREVMNKIRENEELWERLRAKCRWEGMNPYLVIREWGHPETWPK